MGSTRRLTFLQGALEFLQLGLILGLCHTMMELVWLGWYGVRLEKGDFPALLLVYGGLAMLFCVLLWTLFFAISSLGIFKSFRNGSSARAWFLLVVLPGYAFVGSWVIQRISDAKTALIHLGIFLVLAVILLLRYRKRCSPGRAIPLALLGLMAIIYPLTLFAHEQIGIPAEHQGGLLIRLLWPGVLLFLAAVIVPGRTPAEDGRRPLWRAIASLAVLLGVVLLLWATVWPLELRYHLHEDSSLQVAERGSERPDVLLLILDTLRADHMELFGYERETSPNLTRFAREECVLVKEMIATAPSSLPSHGSIFTGMFSSMHGGHKQFVDDENPPIFGYYVRNDVPTLAEAMADLGYHAVGLSANFLLRSYGLGRGFTHYNVISSSRLLAEGLTWVNAFRYRGRSLGRELEKLLPRVIARSTLVFDRYEPTYRRAREMSRLAARWYEEYPDDPVFMMINYFDVHDPYLPVPEFDQHFVKEPPGLDWVGYPKGRYAQYLLGNESFSEAEIEYMVGQYDAEILYLDRELNHFFDHLKKIDRYDETMIIIISDHGEGFLEHGFLNHGASVYQPQILVPALVKMPRSWTGELPDPESPIQFVDIFPTVMHAIGGEIPESVEGSIWAADRDYALSELYCQFCRFTNIANHRPDLKREVFALVTKGHKVIFSEQTGIEHYDLLADPGEQQDLAGSDPELEQYLVTEMVERLATQFDPRTGGQSDRDMVDQLRSLGYVQ